MPKFNPNKFKKYVSKLDIKNPQHQRKALKYVLDRSEYKPSERKTILNSFDKGDYSNFLTKERRSASWDDFAKYRNVYHTIEEAPISKPDTSGFGHIRKNVIGPSEESVDNKRKNFVNGAKEYKQSTSNTTQPLQSGPISANDFAAMSGSDNRASSYMGKRLANRLNGTKAKIKAIQDNADLSEVDKTMIPHFSAYSCAPSFATSKNAFPVNFGMNATVFPSIPDASAVASEEPCSVVCASELPALVLLSLVLALSLPPHPAKREDTIAPTNNADKIFFFITFPP